MATISGQIKNTNGVGISFAQIQVFMSDGITPERLTKSGVPVSYIFNANITGNYGPVQGVSSTNVVRAFVSGHTFLDGTASVAPVCTDDPSIIHLYDNSTIRAQNIATTEVKYLSDVIGKTLKIGGNIPGQSPANFGTITLIDGKTGTLVTVKNTVISTDTVIPFSPYLITLQPFLLLALQATNVSAGTIGYCFDCLKIGEVSGSGTGTLVYFSTGTWLNISTDTPAST